MSNVTKANFTHRRCQGDKIASRSGRVAQANGDYKTVDATVRVGLLVGVKTNVALR